MFPDICHVRFYERKLATNCFSLESLLLFSKFFVFNNLLGPKELFLLLPQHLPEYLTHTFILFPDVCHARWNEKNKSIIFFHWKVCLFFKNLCFQQLLRSQRKAFITSTVKVGILVAPLKIGLWGLSHSIIREKGRQIFFSLEMLPSFFKIMCFQQPLRSPRKWSFDLHNNRQKYLVDPYNFFRDIFHVRYHEKKETKNFSSPENFPFFPKICVFNNLLSLKKRHV